MQVRILKVETGESVSAAIERSSRRLLPSLHDEGWKFNFASLSKKLKNASTYVLVTEETPHEIEGCLIFQLLDDEVPYGAYLEVAPHNRGEERKYDHVAGCLIAYAFQLSLDKGVGPYNGQLFFDVSEQYEEDEQKVRNNYLTRYGAEEVEGTTMKIADKNGHALITKYLNEGQGSAKT